MSFSRMTVASRLYAGFGLVLVLLVVVTAVAMVKVSRIDQALRDNNNVHVQVQRYAINFRGSAHDRSIAVRDVVLSPTLAFAPPPLRHFSSLGPEGDFVEQTRWTPWATTYNMTGGAAISLPVDGVGVHLGAVRVGNADILGLGGQLL